jgi:hypothetical protein
MALKRLKRRRPKRLKKENLSRAPFTGGASRRLCTPHQRAQRRSNLGRGILNVERRVKKFCFQGMGIDHLLIVVQPVGIWIALVNQDFSGVAIVCSAMELEDYMFIGEGDDLKLPEFMRHGKPGPLGQS